MKPTKILFATLVAALVSFVWGFLSWAILPWHQPLKFDDEMAVAATLKANARDHGLYVIPWSPNNDQAAMDDAMKRFANGPYFYGVVRPGTSDFTMGKGVLLSLARSWVAALLLLLILTKCARGFGARMGLCVLLGLLPGLNAQAPMWIWMESPTSHTMKMIADGLIEVVLAGAVLAFFLKSPKPTAPATG